MGNNAVFHFDDAVAMLCDFIFVRHDNKRLPLAVEFVEQRHDFDGSLRI
jgi:hypothetical protein